MDILTSIPLPLHESAHDLWYPSTTSQAFTFAPTNSSSISQNQTQAQQQQQTQQRQTARTTAPRTILSHLRADEHAISVRRTNIRRYGAGWLKPPGLAKTMQGIWDEAAEREEAEATAQREAALAEAQAAAELLAAGDDNVGGQADGDEAPAERDLDDDIPDADDDAGEWSDSDEEGDALPMNEFDGDFGPDGMPMALGGEEAEYAMERDLDGDVPDAGSYQHTDTDVEDSSSEEDESGIGRSSIGMASVVGFAGLDSSPMGQARR